MKKRILKTIRLVLVILFVATALIAGILLFRVFLAYFPGANIGDLFQARLGMPAFNFFGITAGILISFPVILAAFEIYFRFSRSYVHFVTENGFIHLSDESVSQFINDSVSETRGVASVDVQVSVFKENRIGVHIWVDTDDRVDYVSFSQKIQQKVIRDLDFHFGIKKIRFFHVYVESTDIGSAENGYKVKYK